MLGLFFLILLQGQSTKQLRNGDNLTCLRYELKETITIKSRIRNVNGDSDTGIGFKYSLPQVIPLASLLKEGRKLGKERVAEAGLELVQGLGPMPLQWEQ
jgi:hypothetical protein